MGAAKLLLVIACLCFVSQVLSVALDKLARDEWLAFKARFNKSYTDAQEDDKRMKIFLANKQYITEHNAKAGNGSARYTLGINKYFDMMHQEFLSFMNGYKYNEKHSRAGSENTYLSSSNIILPAEVDWRKKGYVTPIKDQGQCRSCWAFSATGSLEGQHFRKTGKLVSLSEQNLIDCSRPSGNYGCNGGWMNKAFAHIKRNHGIDTEKSYPYTGRDSWICHFKKESIGATVTGFDNIQSGSVQHLLNAAATVGPISVAIDAGQPSFQHYHKGVYDEPNCSTTKLNHAVLVVGYGTDEKGVDYWIIKNSWGTSWGEKGYMRMKRDNSNLCGIATAASYPLV